MKQWYLWQNEFSWNRMNEAYMEVELHSESKNRPVVLIVPGGGYVQISESETNNIGKFFFDLGFHTAILHYTVNPTYSSPLYTKPMEELSRAIRLIRKKAKEWYCLEDSIIVCGFSARAHLAATEAVHVHDFWEKDTELAVYSNCPDYLILSYPVITAKRDTHVLSRRALLGEYPSEKMLEYMSVERWVDNSFPPSFIWHSAADQEVSVNNSFLLGQACQKAGVSYALHIFSKGDHGEHSISGEKGNNPEIDNVEEILKSWLLQMRRDWFL